MTIQEEILDNVAILTLSGSLLSVPSVRPFHDHVKKLIQSGLPNVVVNFEKAKWFGSAMLGVMTASLTTARTAGGDLRLTGMTKKIEHILTMTHLATVFRSEETVDRAVASFKNR